MKFTIPANSQKPMPGNGGTYLYVKSATGPFRIIVEGNDGKCNTYDIDDNATQIRRETGISKVEFFDRSGADNDIEASIGYDQFLPRPDNQIVKIADTLDVEFATPQPVKFNTPQDVQFAATQDVNLASQSVPMITAPALGATLVTPAAFTGATTGYPVSPVGVTKRKILIKALQGNTGIGWIGSAAGHGYALEKGEAVSLETTAAVTLFATVAGDTFTVIEVDA